MAYKKYSDDEKNEYFDDLTAKVDEYLLSQSQKIYDFLESKQKKQIWENPVFSNNAIGNPCSGITYNFENTLLLSLVMEAKGYKSPHFVTAKQAFDNGLTMDKGTTGHYIIQYFGRKLFPLMDKVGDQLVPRRDDEGEVVYAYRRQSKLVKVFNLEQLKGEIPKSWVQEKKHIVLENEDEVQGVLDVAIEVSPAPIRRIKAGYNCYTPSTKTISLHESDNFKSRLHEISTLFHEQGHVTGDKDHYKRECFDRYTENDYFRGQEELVANLTAKKMLEVYGMTANHLGENFDSNHDTYNAGWGIHVFKKNPVGIFEAAAMADRACKFLREKIDNKLKTIPELSYLVSVQERVSEDNDESENKKSARKSYPKKKLK